MCVGTDSYSLNVAQTCTHAMKLCVTCKQTSSVFIRVQSNGMPNHCYSANYSPLQYYPDYKVFDWTVKWNSDVYRTVNYGLGLVDTQTETDDLLCHHEVTSASNAVPTVTFNQGSDV